ncbi:Hsf [Drosophila simulans]|uniref:Hsf n=1 Tax=Drosophila simulans TaxID=7240 RepID=B4NVB7_DROSI|nr:Hsf [Drosophila simulans]
MTPASSDLYNVNFISEDMPTDIFEDALLPDGVEEAAKLDQQQKFGQSTVSSGKFASNFDVPTNSTLLDANQASTSKAAAKAQASEEEGMAVAKYSGAENGNNRDPNSSQLLRMASVDELHGHLESMQDELETLKDLLRGDGVAIDQNMLMGALSRTPNFQLPEDELLLKVSTKRPDLAFMSENSPAGGSNTMCFICILYQGS